MHDLMQWAPSKQPPKRPSPAPRWSSELRKAKTPGSQVVFICSPRVSVGSRCGLWTRDLAGASTQQLLHFEGCSHIWDLE